MMNFPIAIYNRERPNRFLAAVSPILAVILTLALGGAIFAMVGKEPLYSLYVFCVEPLLTLRGWGELGVKMTPLILCALGLVGLLPAPIFGISEQKVNSLSERFAAATSRFRRVPIRAGSS